MSGSSVVRDMGAPSCWLVRRPSWMPSCRVTWRSAPGSAPCSGPPRRSRTCALPRRGTARRPRPPSCTCSVAARPWRSAFNSAAAAAAAVGDRRHDQLTRGVEQLTTTALAADVHLVPACEVLVLVEGEDVDRLQLQVLHGVEPADQRGALVDLVRADDRHAPRGRHEALLERVAQLVVVVAVLLEAEVPHVTGVHDDGLHF